MKKIILIASTCLVSSWAFAGNQASEYIQEAGVVVIRGQSAMDLYTNLNAKEKDLVLVTHQQERMKQAGSVRCVATFLGGFDENQDSPGRYTLADAECAIQLTPGSVK